MNCNHANQSVYRYALGRRETSLCPACKAAMEALGMTFRERRETAITPIVERRQPAWLSRLTAKDFTGRSA